MAHNYGVVNNQRYLRGFIDIAWALVIDEDVEGGIINIVNKFNIPQSPLVKFRALTALSALLPYILM